MPNKFLPRIAVLTPFDFANGWNMSTNVTGRKLIGRKGTRAFSGIDARVTAEFASIFIIFADEMYFSNLPVFIDICSDLLRTTKSINYVAKYA